MRKWQIRDTKSRTLNDTFVKLRSNRDISLATMKLLVFNAIGEFFFNHLQFHSIKMLLKCSCINFQMLQILNFKLATHLVTVLMNFECLTPGGFAHSLKRRLKAREVWFDRRMQKILSRRCQENRYKTYTCHYKNKSVTSSNIMRNDDLENFIFSGHRTKNVTPKIWRRIGK